MSTVTDALAKPPVIGWTRLPVVGTLLIQGLSHRERAIVSAKVSRLAALREAGVVSDAQFQRHWARLFPEPS